jgi:hypothetical protein
MNSESTTDRRSFLGQMFGAGNLGWGQGPGGSNAASADNSWGFGNYGTEFGNHPALDDMGTGQSRNDAWVGYVRNAVKPPSDDAPTQHT